ncbi:hypothetical protein [Streptomyces lavendulae]|uniref:hypothetical protein n=1 Tax=Streptomyces lavendulae TaxID=1914 RepID=UPI0024A11EB5|nr:hypothetical protein [Streptomyces lavendulae]GLX22523.1 hypothetical protein Slala01_61670 [Streptomyces lavendulae subsp. lavendulae]GLX30006.1 hypothetical protein Slala02_58260 [Streptomyces lavendulae subsp. lavendulae]
MTGIVRLLAVLLGATAPEEPMSQLLAFDEAAFVRRVRERRSDSAGPNVLGTCDGHAPVEVGA